MSERWKPENGERYFCVDFGYFGIVCNHCWGILPICDSKFYEVGNVFKTKEDAEAAAEKVNALLLSLHEEQTVTDCNQLPKLTVEVFDRPDCPEWAQYAAVDVQGLAYWYQYSPVADERVGGWKKRGTNRRLIDGFFDRSDWQNSLIERPTKDAFDKLLKNCAEQQVNKILQKARERRLSEQYHNGPEKENTLPDWCKVGEFGYDRNEKVYFKIKRINNKSITLQYPYNEDVESNPCIDFFTEQNPAQARLRQYTADEMRQLVGKVIEDRDSNLFLATSYLPHRGGLLLGGYYYNAGELLDSGLTVDGKTCGVLEHLENGEWVE